MREIPKYRAEKHVTDHRDGGPLETIVTVLEPFDDSVIESYILDDDGTLRRLGCGVPGQFEELAYSAL